MEGALATWLSSGWYHSYRKNNVERLRQILVPAFENQGHSKRGDQPGCFGMRIRRQLPERQRYRSRPRSWEPRRSLFACMAELLFSSSNGLQLYSYLIYQDRTGYFPTLSTSVRLNGCSQKNHVPHTVRSCRSMSLPSTSAHQPADWPRSRPALYDNVAWGTLRGWCPSVCFN